MKTDWSAELKQTAHAYLFLGPAEQTREEALAFAAALNCEAPAEGKGCGRCENCRRLQKGGFADLEILAPDGAYYKIEQIRALQRKAAQSRMVGRMKVFLLTAADAMQDAAANCLLKTLEEPAPGRVLLLLAENGDRILPTVHSRCRVLHWRQAKQPPDGETLDLAWQWLRRLGNADCEEIFAFTEPLAKDREKSLAFLDGAEAVLRDNVLERMTGTAAAFPLPLWDRETLFRGWESVGIAKEKGSFPINMRLLLDTWLLSLKEAFLLQEGPRRKD